MRAERERHLERARSSTLGADEKMLSVPRAAELLGVSRQYLAREGELARARRAEQEAAGKEQTPFADNYIGAVRSGKRSHYWQVSRREVERFAASRVAPTAVVGYDLTFSCPKSVSVLWATAKPTEQAEILESVAAAVGAGVAYLEDHAAYVQGSPHPAKGLVGASFLHATSRALEPQLHHHVVVANMTQRADGKVLALDGRPLFSHAMTAGHSRPPSFATSWLAGSASPGKRCERGWPTWPGSAPRRWPR